MCLFVFFFKQKTAYYMRISDWSSDVCSSDLKNKSISLAALADYDFVGLMEGSALQDHIAHHARRSGKQLSYRIRLRSIDAVCRMVGQGVGIAVVPKAAAVRCAKSAGIKHIALTDAWASRELLLCLRSSDERSEEHTSELQSLLRISYAVFCVTKK